MNLLINVDKWKSDHSDVSQFPLSQSRSRIFKSCYVWSAELNNPHHLS